jgi:hypothetical protein
MEDPMIERRTDEIVTQLQQQAEQSGQPYRFVDVNIYDVEPGAESPDVERTGPIEQKQPPRPEPVVTSPPRRQQFPLVLLLVCLALLLVLLAGSMLVLIPLLTPTASVTIIPVSRQISVTTTILVNAGSAPNGQLADRALASVTMLQQESIPTTGTAHLDAKAGYGTIAFYNAAPSIQLIPAGTLLTGSDGVQVVTEQDASIPPVSYPTLGAATIAAHAVVTGPGEHPSRGHRCPLLPLERLCCQ